MKRFESKIPNARITVPSLPQEIVSLYPSAFYMKGDNPVRIGETKEKDDESFKSVTAWYSCANPDLFGFVLPYLEDMEEAELIDCLKLSKRGHVPIEDEDGELLYLTVCKFSNTPMSKVKEDIYLYPLCPKVSLLEILQNFQKGDKFDDLPIYMPTYERFFMRTRLFPPPMTEKQAQMSLLARNNPFLQNLVNNFFHLDVDMSIFKETEESLRKKVGAVNDDWAYISQDYIGKEYKRIPIKDDMKIRDFINALVTYPDNELVGILKADPPRNNRGIQFTDRRSFVSAWMNSNMTLQK